ncbi:MAG TPA: tetratricopeptide repeat protein [Pyrinomonadaceae bacterium]|jgi:tetratricopeptide (TPR) repeat protein|nr:tetratricopeptide repeat protein [Pyrinomonadaceae bacterium]
MLKPKSFLISILLALAYCHPAFSQATQPGFSQTQPVRIYGTLRYPDGSPAFEVNVRLDKLSGGYVAETRTDRLGKFSFDQLFPQQYHVTIRLPGYREILREVDLVFVSTDNLQIALVPDQNYVGNKPPPASSKLVLDASVPIDARKEFEKADALLAMQKKERTGEAVLHLQKALTLYPTFLEAQLKLGLSYMDLQEWDKAEVALKRAIEINPRAVTSYLALADVFVRQKREAEAEKALRDGLVIDDRSWQARFALARLYYRQGDLSKSGKQVALTIQLNDSFPDAHLLAGNIFLKINDRRNALEQFQEYLRLAPKGEFAAQARQAIEKLK